MALDQELRRIAEAAVRHASDGEELAGIVPAEPLFPRVRQGTQAAEIEPELVATGFDMSDGSDRDLSPTTTATFA